MSGYRIIRLSWDQLQPEARLAAHTEGAGAPDAPGSETPLHPGALAAAAAEIESAQRAGLTPALILHAGELPAGPAEAGWVQRSVAEAFARYAGQVVRTLGGTSGQLLWITLEDPWQIAFGVHQQPEPASVLAAAHHLNLAHGLASLAIREAVPGARVALALRLHVPRAADPERAADLEAAHRVALLGNHIFLGPVLDGSYPVELRRRTRAFSDWGFVRPGDVVAIRQHLDLLIAIHRPPVLAKEVRPGTIASSRAGWFDLDDVDLAVESHATERADAFYDLLTALDNAYDGHPMLAMAGAGLRDPAVLVALEGAVSRAREDGAALAGSLLTEEAR